MEGLGSPFTRRASDEPSFHGGRFFATAPGTAPGTALTLAHLSGPLPDGGAVLGGEGRCQSRAGSTIAAAGWGSGNLLSERSAWLTYADEIDQRWPGLGARDGASPLEETDAVAPNTTRPTRRDAGGGAGAPPDARHDADTWRSLARSLAARSTDAQHDARSMDETLLITPEDFSESDEPEHDAQSVTFADYGAPSGAPSRAPSDLSDGGDDSLSHLSTRRHLSSSYMAPVPPGRREALWSYPRFSSSEDEEEEEGEEAAPSWAAEGAVVGASGRGGAPSWARSAARTAGHKVHGGHAWGGDTDERHGERLSSDHKVHGGHAWGGETDERQATTSATPRAYPSPVHASAQHGAPTASATPRAYPSLTLDLTSAAASWSATGGDREGSFRGSMNAKSSFSRGAVVGSKDGAPRAAGDGGGGRPR